MRSEIFGIYIFLAGIFLLFLRLIYNRIVKISQLQKEYNALLKNGLLSDYKKEHLDKKLWKNLEQSSEKISQEEIKEIKIEAFNTSKLQEAFKYETQETQNLEDLSNYETSKLENL